MNQPFEDTLLLFCLGTENEESKASVFERWTASDWENLVQQSSKHVVAPYLYHRLRTLYPAAAIPADVYGRLREIYLHSASRNMRLYHELGKVLSALKKDDIPVMVLKGAYLAEVIYGNIAIRPMGDVDIMVRKKDLEKAAEKLMQLGYWPERPYWIESHCLLNQHLPAFTKAGSASIELHWSITSPFEPFKVNVDKLWKRAKLAKIANVEVLVLSPEDMLLHLCLHISFNHRFSMGLRSLCDIIETIQSMKNRIAPEQVEIRARQWKATRCTSFTLTITQNLLGATMTDPILKALNTSIPDSESVTWAMEQIFINQNVTPPMSPNLVRVWKARRFQDKVAAFFKFVFVSHQVLESMYHIKTGSKRVYFYYLIRIRDLLLQYGRTILNLFFQDKKAILAAEYENRGNMLEQWLTSGS